MEISVNKLRLFFGIAALLIFLGDNFAYSKEYRISPKGGAFEIQLSKILSDINKIAGNNIITIKVEDGYYELNNTINIEGSIKHPIILEGAKNKQTIISGSIIVEGWQVLPNGMWRCRIPSNIKKGYIPDQLYVNGERAIRARTPNIDQYVIDIKMEKGPIFGVGLTKSDQQKIPSFREDDIPIISIYHKWSISKRFIERYSDTEGLFYFQGKSFPKHNKPEKGNRIFVENTLNGMDQPREWCIDKKGYIYYYPSDDEIIDSIEFRIPVVEKLFVLNKGEFSIRNIIFEHTSYQMPSDGIEFDQAASSMSAAIEVDNARNFVLGDCEVRNIANYGLWVRDNCQNSAVVNNYFHDLGAGSIKIGTIEKPTSEKLTKNVVFENNIVTRYGQLIDEAVGVVLFNASDCRIIHNDIHYGYYTGISLGWSWGYGYSPSKRNEVANNRISHIGDGRLNDLAAIYTLGKSEGTTIHQNYITDVVSGDFRGWGIYADQGTTGIIVEKNMVFRTTSGGFHQNYGNNNVVRNNIFAWGEESQLTLSSVLDEYEDCPLVLESNIIIMEKGMLMSGAGLSNEKFISKSNCYWSLSNVIPKVGGHSVYNWIRLRDRTSVYCDPGFRDVKRNDFRFCSKNVKNIIRFEEFNYSKAGVYGKRKWKKLAESIR